MFGRLNARKLLTRRFSLLAVMALAVLAFTVAVAGAALQSVGPVNPNTGYPTTFTDTAGVTLEHCLDQSGFCLEPPPNPNAPASTPGNIGEESFWWTAEADLDLPSGGTGLLVLALEGAFANDEVVAGDQVVFGRVRLRAEDLTPNRSYTFTHPFGSQTLTSDAEGQIRLTEDIGCFDTPCAPNPPDPGNFRRALNSNIGPFLKWDPAVNPQAPAGYLGNPNVPHAITGSPTGNNLFRMARTGAGSDTATTNLFAVSGKLSTGAPAPAPNATLNPTSLAFGDQTVNTNSAERTSTLTNSGNAALAITSIGDTGPNAGDFTTTEDCPASLPAGASCTIRVIFRPSATGQRTATVNVVDNDNTDPGTVALSGNGVAAAPTAPNAVVAPTSHDFGTVTVGSTSGARVSTLTNNGNAPLTITSIDDGSADYTTNEDCPASLPAGQSCSITMVFHPTATGTRNATVTVNDNDPDATTIALTGVGQAAPANTPNAVVTPTSHDFGTVAVGSSSASRTSTLTNNGTAALAITSIADDSDQYTTTENCPDSLPVNGSCTITMVFSPTSAGTKTATVTVNDNDPDATTIALTGVGQAAAPAPAVNLSAVNLAFPATNIGTTSAPRSVTLTNSGNGPLTITTITVVGGNAGDFAKAASSTCDNGETLAPGATCQVDVTFTPTAAGSRSATLRFATNASSSPDDVGLNGTGVDPNPPAQTPASSVSPAALQFGGESILLGTLLGTDSETRFVSVTSTGTAPLAIGLVTIGGNNPGDFRVVSNTCTGQMLQPGANCVIGVVFHPTALGTRSAVLNIASNAPSPTQVGLGGKGMLLPILI